MSEHRTYKQNAIDNIFNTVWGSYADGTSAFPKGEIRVAGICATFFFDLGYLEQAREASYRYSIYMEKEAMQRSPAFNRIDALFFAGLYRDLAQRQQEARTLWLHYIEQRQALSMAQLYKWRQAHLLIYEGYALTKLGRHSEITEPVRAGFEGICQGKGVFKAPHRNSRVYALADFLLTLREHALDPTLGKKQAAQEALAAYKRENVRYGRLGYPIIFDLQFSFPDLLHPVLPAEDPAAD